MRRDGAVCCLVGKDIGRICFRPVRILGFNVVNVSWNNLCQAGTICQRHRPFRSPNEKEGRRRIGGDCQSPHRPLQINRAEVVFAIPDEHLGRICFAFGKRDRERVIAEGNILPADYRFSVEGGYCLVMRLALHRDREFKASFLHETLMRANTVKHQHQHEPVDNWTKAAHPAAFFGRNGGVSMAIAGKLPPTTGLGVDRQ